MKRGVFVLALCLCLLYPYPVYAQTYSGNWRNAVIDLDFQIISGETMSVRFRYKDENNHYRLDYLPNRFELWTVDQGSSAPNSGGFHNSTEQGQWHHLRVEMREYMVSVWLDQQFVFDANISYANLDRGAVVLSDQGVLFNNIQIQELVEDPTPVIFIPGIGGSALRAGQEIVWSENDGHGGIFSHTYPAGETIWVNPVEAIKFGNDDYFDVLRLGNDGFTPMADVQTGGSFIDYSYQDVDPFFQSLGYIKGQNYFVFTYDWRRSTDSSAIGLAALVDEVLASTGQPKVNLIAHSMGGLVARSYIFHEVNAAKVNQLIELGVPHLGTTSALKQLIDGDWLSTMVWIFPIHIIPPSQMYDLVHNFSSMYQLLPHEGYFDQGWPFPLIDDREPTPGPQDFNFLRSLVARFGGQLHLWPFIVSTNTHNVKITTISGSGFPTLGQIHKHWLVTWPLTLIPIDDEIYINGDGTVPTQASDYYVEQDHQELTEKDGAAMNIVKTILFNDNFLSTTTAPLEGQQITIENADIEIEESPGVFYTKNKTATHIFVRKNATTFQTFQPKPSTTIKVRTYAENQIKHLAIYQNIPAQPTQIKVDQTTAIIQDNQSLTPLSQVSGTTTLDQAPPSTGGKIFGNQVELSASDNDSGIYITQYSLDGGQTIHTYTGPLTISGSQEILVTSTDKAGNQEIPKNISFTSQPSPSPSPPLQANIAFSKSSPTSSSQPIKQSPQVLGIQKEVAQKNSTQTADAWILLLFPIGIILWKIIY